MLMTFACPHCRAPVCESSSGLLCGVCRLSFPVQEGIPDFSSRPHYWNLVDEERMEVLIEIARDSSHSLEYRQVSAVHWRCAVR